MTDPRILQFERERADAVELAHRAMATSYIGGPPAGLRGDADRMVAALIKQGWTPPSKAVTEHAVELCGSLQLRSDHPDIDTLYPLAEWTPDWQRRGVHVFKRRIVVVDDWTEVPRG